MPFLPDDNYKGYKLPPLITGTLIKRYKRFLADIRLNDGSIVTAHCPNSGSMRECCEPGRKAWLSISDNPKRKLKYTWELLEMPESLVGINTIVPNKIVKDSIAHGLVPELSGYTAFKPEIKTSEHTRLDILLTNMDSDNNFLKNKEKHNNGNVNIYLQPDCYVEVKNCTLVQNRIARFPDAVTTRGQKHLLELKRLVEEGNRGVIFFLVQRMDADYFMPAADIDPEYAKILFDVHKSGVEIIIRSAMVTPELISIGEPVPLISRSLEESLKLLSK
ncbi:Sugar fermentation stimulation protein homolog [Desulfamplus magnetovallimortis]|uniref:Sugar fermentation stimulation protein homolog n=1 Tax=Desulfamplus magnetovallimortis TaxID=1246637 RepID=A0A1W1H6P3_9BACT|nr:DNA/RNA nuclease SfsA [Desulfamplus magnetovallimortis]SLM28142.1 Sugar fermentation stimulation protein homolog [Desulfamplus magnetovallimortis]